MYPDGVILALDEMSLYFQATLTRVWAPVGQTPVVAVYPQRDHIHFYGALNLRDGRQIAQATAQETSDMTTSFVMQLMMWYPQPILLLLDRAPWHYGEFTGFIDQTDHVHVIYFPPACPDLNPQEHVWARARDAISHNHTCQHFPDLIDDFDTYLNETLFATDFMEAFTPLGLGVF